LRTQGAVVAPRRPSLTHWRVEDTLRFVKQIYHLEDVRVLSYQRLRNMKALALLAH
jgi:hypothetical protein